MKRSISRLNARRVCFRKWGNKSFSVFASLKALVRIGTISASYSLLSMPLVTLAQPDTTIISKNLDIDEVVISTPQSASTYSELMRAVVVLTTEEFSRLPITNLQELIESIASVDIRQRGGHGVQADLMVRGGSFDQVLILLNGINITDPQTGHHNLNIPIDIESIERIELLHGPGARVYGPGAFSGAINIITNTKGKNYAKISATAGEYGLIKTNASTSVNINKTSLFLSASNSKSDGHSENTDFIIHNLFAHARLENLFGHTDFQAGYQEKAFGAQSFYTPRFPEQFEKTGTLFTSLSHYLKIKRSNISASAYFRNHTDRFELFRNQSPDWYKSHNYHATQIAGGKIQASTISQLGRTRAGYEYRNEKIASNVLGLPLEVPKPINGFSDTSYTRGASRSLINLFFDHTLYFERFMLSAGGLMAYNSSFGLNWNYGIDLSYKVFDNLSMYSSFSNAIRFPTFTDLYYNGPTNKGNAELKPEIANNYEIGIKTSGARFNTTATIFHRRAKDLIDWVMEPDDEIWSTMNHTQINTTGIEFFVHISDFQIPLFRSISAGYNYMITDKKSNALLSYYALDYLKHKATVSVVQSIYKNFGASWAIIWQDRAGSYAQYPLGIEVPYNSFWLANLRMNWQGRGIEVFTDINNLGNVSHIDIGNIPLSGRWLSFGIRVQLD